MGARMKENAICCFKNAIAFDPKQGGPWIAFAYARATMKEYQATIDAIQKALRLDDVSMDPKVKAVLQQNISSYRKKLMNQGYLWRCPVCSYETMPPYMQSRKR
jgi:tetratricopeptide (TPR) repeat protein